MIEGSCHCGTIRFRITPPESMTSCNCSICRRYQALWAYCPPATVEMDARDEDLVSYIWGDGMIAFRSCRHCGCTTHYTGAADSKPHTRGRIAVNMQMVLNPKDLEGIQVRHWDGADSWQFLD